ncbi:hypothetical protein pb186bvf_004588 [Paramecium bursaria]
MHQIQNVQQSTLYISVLIILILSKLQQNLIAIKMMSQFSKHIKQFLHIDSITNKQTECFLSDKQILLLISIIENINTIIITK